MAEFKRMGYKWASHCDSHTIIVGTQKQAISKITLEAPNEKQTVHSPQITSPSMEFTPPPDYSAVIIFVSPRTIGIPETSIPVDSITKETLEVRINVFIEKIFGDPLG